MMMQDMKLDWLPPAMEETVKRIEAVSGTVEGPETLKAASPTPSAARARCTGRCCF